MALITTGSWPAVVQKDLSLIFVDQYRDFPSMLPLLFRFKTAEQGTEYDLETGDIPAMAEFTGDMQYPEIRQGYTKSITETEYAQGLKVTRRLLRNDLYGVVQESTQLLAISVRHLRETRGAFPFVNAFNTSFTVGDGLQLCSNAHTSRFGGTTQDNLNTLALSPANLQTSRVAMKKFQTNRDNPMVNISDMIIAPLDLEDRVYEIIKSMGKVDTANNNRNYHEGRYKAVIWDNYLTDTNDWFLVNSMIMKQKLVFREWEPVEFSRSGEYDTKVSKFGVYTSLGVSSVEWRWVYGNQVS